MTKRKQQKEKATQIEIWFDLAAPVVPVIYDPSWVIFARKPAHGPIGPYNPPRRIDPKPFEIHNTEPQLCYNPMWMTKDEFEQAVHSYQAALEACVGFPHTSRVQDLEAGKRLKITVEIQRTTFTASVDYIVLYHDTWGPMIRFSINGLPEGEDQFDFETVCRHIVPGNYQGLVRTAGVGGRPSIHLVYDDNTFSRWELHPCGFYELITQLNLNSPLDKLMSFITLMGRPIGLNIPPEIAAASGSLVPFEGFDEHWEYHKRNSGPDGGSGSGRSPGDHSSGFGGPNSGANGNSNSTSHGNHGSSGNHGGNNAGYSMNNHAVMMAGSSSNHQYGQGMGDQGMLNNDPLPTPGLALPSMFQAAPDMSQFQGLAQQNAQVGGGMRSVNVNEMELQQAPLSFALQSSTNTSAIDPLLINIDPSLTDNYSQKLIAPRASGRISTGSREMNKLVNARIPARGAKPRSRPHSRNFDADDVPKLVHSPQSLPASSPRTPGAVTGSTTPPKRAPRSVEQRKKELRVPKPPLILPSEEAREASAFNIDAELQQAQMQALQSSTSAALVTNGIDSGTGQDQVYDPSLVNDGSNYVNNPLIQGQGFGNTDFGNAHSFPNHNHQMAGQQNYNSNAVIHGQGFGNTGYSHVGFDGSDSVSFPNQDANQMEGQQGYGQQGYGNDVFNHDQNLRLWS